MAALLVALVAIAFFVAVNLQVPAKQEASKPFFVGIETGWNSNVSYCEALIDKVKNYINLLIIASPLILRNETMLNETCNYAYNAGMYFMPAYYQDIFGGKILGYAPASWFALAKEQYGDKLLGIYFYDEPGGSQLDETVNFTSNNAFNETRQPTSYMDYANWYFQVWTQGNGVPVAANLTHSLGSSLFTSDYALYWFDYELGYDTVFAQFGWNNSRTLQISLVRGAAEAQSKSWGAMITWTYNGTSYLESAPQIYSDMVLAYNSGASYIVIYDSSRNYTNTTLTQPDFNTLKEFWNYMQQNPSKHGNLKADTALVLPQDYGFGFRSPYDSVWQYHNSTSWTQKLYSDITNLLKQHNSSLNIVYSDPQFKSVIQSEYSKILYWPQNFENGVSYPVNDVNNSLGYSTIQGALSSYATYKGDTVLLKSGTFQENIAVTKPVKLTSQNRGTSIIEGLDNGTALTVVANNVTLTGFTIRNSGYPSSMVGTGIRLENAHNCTITGNTITNNYVGVILTNSTDNVFRGNEISGNTYNLILQNSKTNDIDSSNIVDGKPYLAG